MCERRNGTGEGVLIDKGTHLECPCGKYRQSLWNSKHSGPTESLSRIHVELPKEKEYQPDSIVQSVIQKFKDRAEQGEKSYNGNNLDRSDYKVEDWINELGNEIHDSYLYLERFKQDYQKIKHLFDLSITYARPEQICTQDELDEYYKLLEWYKNSPKGRWLWLI